MLYEENELAHALGLSGGSPAVSGVSIDSRTIEKGDAFFALKGERFDASQFVEVAFERGAACALVAPSSVSSRLFSKSDEAARKFSERLLQVEDAESALVRCGCYARGRTSARIVAITGSLGKTSLRAMLQEILQATLQKNLPVKVSASHGNLNNHIGVPLSLARMARDSSYGIFELGMNHAGEIAKLGAWVRPHVGVITSIATVHSEFFENDMEICDAKGELLEWVSEAALLPATEPYASRLRAKAASAGVERLAFFGSEQASKNISDYILRNYVLQKFLDNPDASEDSVSVQATFPERTTDAQKRGQAQGQAQGRREFRWQVGGRGYARALTSLCALAVCDLLGLVADELSPKLLETSAGLLPPRGRGRLSRLSLAQPPRQIRLIDESYNASPLAVQNALSVLSRFPPRRLAALGDMLELGAEGARLHADLASYATRCCDLVFTCGSLSETLYKALPRSLRGAHSKDAGTLAKTLHARLKDGDTLLVKGSLGSQMATIVSYLEQRAVGHGY